MISGFKYLSLVSAAALIAALPNISAAHEGEEHESTEAKIARAMTAAPPHVTEHATYIDMDGTLLRQGTNGWTCIPGVPLIPGDKNPMCNDAVWTEWLSAFSSGQPFSTDRIGISYMLAGDAFVNNDNPGATDPNDGGMWIQEGPHVMLLLPNIAMMAGLPTSPVDGGAYVMWGTTPMAHIMLPTDANGDYRPKK